MTHTMAEELAQAAADALQSAYAPYSGFRVGAALVTASGNRYTGCNLENVSFGLTNCAERVAIAAAVRGEGPGVKVSLLVVVAESDSCSPCGACRQVISELAADGAVIGYRWRGEMKFVSIDELLPDRFTTL